MSGNRTLHRTAIPATPAKPHRIPTTLDADANPSRDRKGAISVASNPPKSRSLR
jgi:hypothetical protein